MRPPQKLAGVSPGCVQAVNVTRLHTLEYSPVPWTAANISGERVQLEHKHTGARVATHSTNSLRTDNSIAVQSIAKPMCFIIFRPPRLLIPRGIEDEVVIFSLPFVLFFFSPLSDTVFASPLDSVDFFCSS